MDYPDIYQHIKAVAENYRFEKTPQLVVDIQNIIHKVFLFLRDLWNMLRDLLSKILPSSAPSGLAANILQWGLYCAGFVGLLLLIYFINKRLSANQLKKQSTQAGAYITDTILDSQAWKKKAAELAEKEDFRNACRAISLSALQYLDETEIATFAPTKTNYEYAYLLKPYPEVASIFKDLSMIVEPVWYGYQTAENQDYLSCLYKLDQLERQINSNLPNEVKG